MTSSTTPPILTSPDDPRLGYQIRFLPLGRRARAACRSLGVHTVGEFLHRDQKEFLELRNCGARTYDQLAHRVHRFLQQPASQPSASDDPLTHAIRDVVRDRRAWTAFDRLRIDTVAEFLATPREELLAVPGFGERSFSKALATVQLLVTRLRPVGTQPGAGTLHGPVDASTEAAPHRDNTPNHSDAKGEDDRSSSGQDRTPIRQRPPGARREGDPDLLHLLLEPLDDAQQKLARRRIGWGTPWQSVRALAFQSGAKVREIQDALDAIRVRWNEDDGDGHSLCLLACLRNELDAELIAGDGLAIADRFADNTHLRALIRATGEPDFVVRLLAFAFHDELYRICSGVLTLGSSDQVAELRSQLKQATRPTRLPLRVVDLPSELSANASPGLVRHMIEYEFGRKIEFDRRRGEMIVARADTVGQRIHSILDDVGHEVALEDLLFHYRDRHHRASQRRLLDSLRADSRFLEIRQDTWGLRSWFVDELEIAREEALRIAQMICTEGGRHAIRAVADGDISERVEYVVRHMLRGDARVRDLGRGEFCPRRERESAVLRDLIRDMRKAMGEIPKRHFLRNQSDDRRRLVQRLLEVNRLFVEPDADRVDMLENYPFNGERMRRLLRLVDDYLETRRGYAPLENILDAIQQTEFAGDYLISHLLRDLLRRHGQYEFLPGDLVAQGNLNLGSWVRQRAREALREAGPLTPEEVLIERPELAEFGDCLQSLMLEDPLVASADEVHFQVL